MQHLLPSVRGVPAWAHSGHALFPSDDSPLELAVETCKCLRSVRAFLPVVNLELKLLPEVVPLTPALPRGQVSDMMLSCLEIRELAAPSW